MAVDVGAAAERLFHGVMAPLVLGGAVRPPHAIGARVALALGAAERLPTDIDLASRVQLGRVRRARRLVPLDRLGPPTAAEWALAALLSDILQAASPAFDAALRRGAASRILAVAMTGVERIPLPASPKDALSRHTWFARLLDVARSDTTISWWVGSSRYLGVDPPSRLQAWPSIRRVQVTTQATALLELAPLAFERERLVRAVSLLLERSPLTDLAGCTRVTPPFEWTPSALALVGAPAGRTMALRALARLPAQEVDSALGRASRDLLRRASGPQARAAVLPSPEARAVAALLADRALAQAESGEIGRTSLGEDAAFARGLGAAAAKPALTALSSLWSPAQRLALLAALEPAASSPQGLQATALLGAAGLTSST
jgi:hypothetical protein